MNRKTKLKTLFRHFKKSLSLRKSKPKPHFLGIGAQKGGTTTLYQILKPHPEVFLPDNKEIHYFTKSYNHGEDWYTNQFEKAQPGQLRGEITPYYLFHEEVPKRIHIFKSDIKLIILLRDPVERSLSQYFHSVRLGLEDLPIEEAISAEKKRLEDSSKVIKIPGGRHFSHQEHSYISRSRYEIQIERYFSLFNRSNILILRSEDLFKADKVCLEKISSFLEIMEFPETLSVPLANPGKGESSLVNNKVRQKIRDKLEKTYAWVDKELGINW